ncbi:ATP-binding protein [Thalassotalea euphylliae]|uniref:GAF domain-containing hybrid sensor histidine kinase/response regulator n=1 Tax=Thalassotalea euphylliae TaxID=1655234 RepID=UPI00363ABBFB
MKSAPLTPDEQERLKALYGYDILDTEAEKVFDDLTLLASEICETPIALISLIDPERQWFKSTVGIDAEQTPRDIAFCAHAIHEREIFEINNALEDERFADNPLVTEEPNIRFYAGAQLMTPEGFAIGTLCAISDKPKKLNNHQRKALEILSREVVAQMELRKNLRELKKASDFKTEFLSNISHEIRTPLNAITGFSRALTEQINNHQLPEPIPEYINEIDFSAQRLLHIVNSVLDLSKIESGKMELSPIWFHAQRFLSNLDGMMQINARDKGVYLRFAVDHDVPSYLFFDEGKVGQILINLINNAVKFTPKHKKVIVAITAESGQLRIAVEDEGIGIVKSEQSKLFNKYQQVGENRSGEGTGLGLCITKSLVELMNGTISLSSELNVGTRVIVTLPLTDQAVPEQFLQTPKSTTHLPQLKVLVVEDNPINRKVAKVMFDSLGQNISFAEDGETSLELCEHNTYDIIFMDIHMPGIDGIEASIKIREMGIKTPIIALTADIFQNQSGKHAKFSFDQFLTKPIVKEQLENCLRSISRH